MSGLRPLVVLSVCGLTFSLAYLAVMLWLKVPATEEWEALQRRIASVQQHTPWRRVTSHPA